MSQKQKILVVDDTQSSLNLSVTLLNGIDASIVTATSGEEAIMKTIAEDFDLILMDVVMPGIDGFEAVKLIRKDERNKFIPVLFITAFSADELRIIRGLSLGAIDFITKPIFKEILCIKVNNLLELQKNRQELEFTRKELDQKVKEIKAMSMEERIKSKKEHEIILSACMDGFLLIDDTGKILDANKAYYDMIGYSRNELRSMNISDIEAAEDKKTIKLHLQKVISEGFDKFETTQITKSGRFITVEIGVRYARENSFLYVFIKDITLRIQAKKALTFLAQYSSNTPEEFFKSLSKYLSENLKMDFVFISRLVEDDLVAQTLAVWSCGQLSENIKYPLKGTPCAETIKKKICHFPESICKLFPHDTLLKDLNAESYVGITLCSHTGKPIGLIAAIGRRPLTNTLLAESIIKLAGVRASGELERLDAESAIVKTKSELEKTLIEKESLIVELNKSIARIKTLDTLLPICSGCKKIRDDNGSWEQVEVYIKHHTDAQFSHSICPDCAKKIYPDINIEKLYKGLKA